MIRPNPPRIITAVIAIALCVVGISGTIYPIPVINDFLKESFGVILDRDLAMLALAAAPFILILGSFFRRI